MPLSVETKWILNLENNQICDKFALTPIGTRGFLFSTIKLQILQPMRCVCCIDLEFEN